MHLQARGNIKWARCLFLTAVCLLFLSALPLAAQAADGDPVQTIANPANTKIHVFDYWVYTQYYTSSAYNNSYGINRNYDDNSLRSLWFWTSTNATAHGAWNHWTGYQGGVTQGIVKPVLEDGYPVLAVGSGESLKYLFDENDISTVYRGTEKPVKRAYMNTNELFCVDDSGYYVFNSLIHNAKLNKETGLYTVTEQTNGLFFPVSEGNPTNSNPDGYFFGVHMQTDFSIPVNGQVLNPSGVYQDMVYGFTGDDDVWVFIDGILIGDVGGIHSAQDLNINFATGDVGIRNHEYQNHIYEYTIYDLVVAAIGEEAAQERFLWKEEEDGSYRTFASGTYHTMDFFYLERGGGRSNMRIRYNLVSTYDFTAHKVLLRNEDELVLQENQFRYKLSGYPITDSSGKVILEAVMPKEQPDRDVYWEPNYDNEKLLIEENVSQTPFVKTLVVGNSADGNINFGNADLTGGVDLQGTELWRYFGQTFRYTYEELPPEGAVQNSDGTYTYKGETVYPNEDGTYTFDGITYDSTVFYFEGTISQQGWVSKRYYTDDTYTVQAHVSFANFTNLYDSIGKVLLTAQKRYIASSGEEIMLTARQFSFRLTDISDPDSPVDLETGWGNDRAGRIAFPPLFYSLDNDLPEGQTERTYTYRFEENPGEDPAVTYSDAVYYARVTIADDGNSHLVVDTHYYTDADCTQEVAAAEVEFVNLNSQYGDLTVTKTVGGNSASKDKPFEFTLTLPDMAGQTVSFSRNGQKRRSLELDESGAGVFSLRHDDSITFYGVGAAWSVEETTDDGYTASFRIGDNRTESGRLASGDTVGAETEVAFKNILDRPSPYQYRFSFTKVWLGEKQDSLDFTLYYPNGEVRHKAFNKRVVSETEWEYEAWFTSETDYYVVESVPEGFTVRYENTGKFADVTDRCHNGGRIINYKTPPTGDSSQPLLWTAMILLGLSAASFRILRQRKRRASS